jgi:hypothetical protein
MNEQGLKTGIGGNGERTTKEGNNAQLSFAKRQRQHYVQPKLRNEPE